MIQDTDRRMRIHRARGDSGQNEAKKPSVPGNVYSKNLFKFVDLHVEFGELYMECRKGKYEAGGLLCDYCTKTPTVIQGPVLPVPRPFPDPSRLPDHHYKNCSETPILMLLEIIGSRMIFNQDFS